MNLSTTARASSLKESAKSAVVGRRYGPRRYSPTRLARPIFVRGICRARNFVGRTRRRNSDGSRGKKSEKKSEDGEAEGENQSKATREAEARSGAGEEGPKKGGSGEEAKVGTAGAAAERAGRVQRRQGEKETGG